MRQRLHLLYPQRHCFALAAGDDTFTVSLALRLSGEPAAEVAPTVYLHSAQAPAWATASASPA